MNGVISRAITERRVLSFHYNGEPVTVEPYAYGVDTMGHETLLAWQTPEEKRGWRLFHVTNIQGVESTSRHFSGPRPDYKRNEPAMWPIYARI